MVIASSHVFLFFLLVESTQRVYGFRAIFVSARTIKRHHHHHTTTAIPPYRDRHSAYIAIAGSDIDRSDLFKPAPYLLSDTQISPKCLFRVRTQHTKEVSTHNHVRPVNGRLAHTSYGDRTCPFCHSTLVVGNESHYLFGCPSITPVMEQMYAQFKKLLK